MTVQNMNEKICIIGPHTFNVIDRQVSQKVQAFP